MPTQEQKISLTLVCTGKSPKKVKVLKSHRLVDIAASIWPELQGKNFTIVAKEKILPEGALAKTYEGERVIVVPPLKGSY